jgi:serine/threonine protein phosphatase 1
LRTLVIGDIHGCYRELMELIEKAAIAEGDRIIALGDILDRGPDSPAVLDFFQRSLAADSLMGNHERKHLTASRGKAKAALGQEMVREQFGQEYNEVLRYIAGFPDYIEVPEAVLIHGLYEPGVPLKKQRSQILNGVMSGESYLRRLYDQPWYELYDGTKPIIAGHHDYSKDGKPTILEDRVFLIDTGCCYGKALTGLLLPDFKLISVKSKENYWGRAMQSRRSRFHY